VIKAIWPATADRRDGAKKMGLTRGKTPVLTVSLILMTVTVSADQPQTLNGHPVRLDEQNRILSWVEPQSQAYDRVIRLAWRFLLNDVPIQGNGLTAYYTYCCLDSDTLKVRSWPHNPAGLTAMLIDSAIAYYAYSGKRGPLDLAKSLADYQIAHGTTRAGWRWARVPYASSNAGATDYRGADGFLYSEKPNVGDGYGYLEPDKVGELGFGYLRLYEVTGNEAYRQAGLDCADALAKNVREGDAGHSPWPFRVNAETGVVREEYSANVIGPIKLFSELIRLNVIGVPAYQRARALAWNWMMKYPIQNDAWSGYFEDVYQFDRPVNFNQYSAMETARYLMQHPEEDPRWREHVEHLIRWVEKTFIFVAVKNEPGIQWGANVVSEQVADMNKMGSHTARYAAINALWYELTGDLQARQNAFYSFNWASYMCRENGLVNVGPVDQSLWFSDGYGDYIRHFLSGMGSVPEWAPSAESHLLKSTSVIGRIEYGNKTIQYWAADDDGAELLKLNFVPKTVTKGNQQLQPSQAKNGQGWTFDPESHLLRVRRTNSKHIVIIGS
jgi:hypothetical protein